MIFGNIRPVVIWEMLIIVSEEPIASSFRIAIKTVAEDSSEMFFTKLHDVTSQMTTTLINSAIVLCFGIWTYI
jgi:hypothetical protein